MSTVLRLMEALGAACPIVGAYIGVEGDPATVRIDYAPEATAPQRAAAQTALAAFDWSQAAHDAWSEDQHPERKALRQAAAQAVSDIDAYLAIANPNNAQVVAQVRRLSQQQRAVIRRLVQLD